MTKLKNRKRWVAERMAQMFAKRSAQGKMIDRLDPKAKTNNKPIIPIDFKW